MSACAVSITKTSTLSSNNFSTLSSVSGLQIPIAAPTLNLPLSSFDAKGFNVSENRPISIAVIDVGFAGLYTSQVYSLSELPASSIDWSSGFIANSSIARFHTVNSTGIRAWTEYIDPSRTFSNLTFRDGEDSYCLYLSESYTCDNTPDNHGTLVTSTLISNVNDATGVAGVAPQAKIIPIKVGNGVLFTDKDISVATLELTNRIISTAIKVDVVNMSFGPSPATISSYIKNYSRRWS